VKNEEHNVKTEKWRWNWWISQIPVKIWTFIFYFWTFIY